MKHPALALILWLVALSARGESFTDHWVLGARVGGMVTDNALRLDGSAEYLSILRTFGEKRALELELGADQLDFSMDYGLRHTTLALNYLEINRVPLWDPYFLIGVGVTEFRAPSGITEGRDPMFQLATGGNWELSRGGRLRLRAELRFRYDLNDTGQPGQDGFGDAIVTFGLAWRL